MRSFLTALQEGRLIELPENNKEKALQLLASVIEAIPDMRPGTDIVGGVLSRERQTNTGLGYGWACPHARGMGEGDLQCAIGWSPAGIDYGSSDGKPVHVIILYYIPETAKSLYLKEISALAKAIHGNETFRNIGTASDLNVMRNVLLDLTGKALETVVPDATARMIRLETRVAEAVGQPGAAPVPSLPMDRVIPFWAVSVPMKGTLILAQDAELISGLEAVPDLGTALARNAVVDVAGYRISVRQSSGYQSNRTLFDCFAVQLAKIGKPA